MNAIAGVTQIERLPWRVSSRRRLQAGSWKLSVVPFWRHDLALRGLLPIRNICEMAANRALREPPDEMARATE